jgi:probable selenium-dependent hydroxylase accessory protein YqeC
VSEELLDLLQARRGIVCAVGAGGKKTTLYRLFALHPGRVALTSTVHIPPLPNQLGERAIVMEEPGLAAAVKQASQDYPKIAYFRPSEKRGRFAGVAPERPRQIHESGGFDVTLVKADGARARLIKAPAEVEPRIPLGADIVLAVLSARALGEPLSERIAHRIAQVESVTGARAGEIIEPVHLARLLTAEQGLLKHVGQAAVIPILNMADEREAQAIETARLALELTDRFDRVVLAAMRRDNPLVRVVRRE